MKRADRCLRALLPVAILAMATIAAAQTEPEPPPIEPPPTEAPPAEAPPVTTPPVTTPPVETAAVETPPSEPLDEPRMLAEYEGWFAQATGLDDTVATQRNPDNPFDNSSLAPDHGTETEVRWRLGFNLPGEWGSIVFTSFQHSEQSNLSRVTPGEYVWGEELVQPLFAGYNLDGLSDGFDSTTQFRLEDLRLDYYGSALDKGRVNVDWFVGWRRVEHHRSLGASYYGLLTDLPGLIDPLVENASVFLPVPERATLDSRFDGRGPEGGLRFEVDLWEDRIAFEGGFAVAALRGDLESLRYSTTAFYALVNPPVESGEVSRILLPPYSEFGVRFRDNNGDPIPLAASIQQILDNEGFTESTSGSADVIELDLGFRVRVIRQVDLTLGFRSSRYSDIGADLLRTSEFERTETAMRSATYEGFYAGARFHLF